MELINMVETPPVHYKICNDEFYKILGKYIKLEKPKGIFSKLTTIISSVDLVKLCNIKDAEVAIKLFNELVEYEDYSIIEEPCDTKEEKEEEDEEHKTPATFDIKEVNALFYFPSLKTYKYIKLKIQPSTIKEAGFGAFAMEKIPKGARGFYKGIAKKEENANMYYSWNIKSFDPTTGITDYEDNELHYVDAEDIENSNWTRFVNCGMKKKMNNMDSDQLYDKFFYVATKDIKEGDELFIDYGIDYRKYNLKLKGRY